jgi:hypothetical protein
VLATAQGTGVRAKALSSNAQFWELRFARLFFSTGVRTMPFASTSTP